MCPPVVPAVPLSCRGSISNPAAQLAIFSVPPFSRDFFRRPLWQSLPPATAMTLTSEACTSLSNVCCWCVTPARNASSTLREASFTSHTALSICVFYCLFIVGVARLPMLNPVNREAVPLVHTIYLFMCCVFFSSHTPLSFERELLETILLFSDSGGSEVEPCEDSTRSR